MNFFFYESQLKCIHCRCKYTSAKIIIDFGKKNYVEDDMIK